jgi:hypothetical protein
MSNTDIQLARLEAISNADVNRIEMVRDRVGNWRVIIDEHFTDLYVDARDKVLAVAIEKTLVKYDAEKSLDIKP